MLMISTCHFTLACCISLFPSQSTLSSQCSKSGGSLSVSSGDEDHVELAHADHGARHRSHVVVAAAGRLSLVVQAAVAHADEVDVAVVLGLRHQVVLDRRLDRLVGLRVQHHAVDGALGDELVHTLADRTLVHTLLYHGDRSHCVVSCCHRRCLFQSVLRDGAAVEKNAKAVAFFDGVHVGVLEDGHGDWLLGQEAHGRPRHSKVNFGSLATVHADD
mmetsp:Transcript_33030/g.40875  ORF Transcript_33030/g.40875 Transcript_33030/m.40875 type:complete len:217 (-) Transcript_33030:370-1020(-)